MIAFLAGAFAGFALSAVAIQYKPDGSTVWHAKALAWLGAVAAALGTALAGWLG